MDDNVTEPADVAAARSAARDWVAGAQQQGLSGRALREAVVDAGYAAPSWPIGTYGLGVSMAASRAVAEELARGGLGGGQDVSNLWANTVLAFGNADLQARLLRPLLLGEVGMCLLYSEPGAGSDLAAVQTRADRDGDEWVINGQKVWTSNAVGSDYGMLIARTNWDVPKHKGISFFFLPMKQPGIEVRPIRQATGDARFNEVFITDARVPAANLLGDLNDGWRVLQTALMYERMVLGASGVTRRPAVPPGGGRPARETEAEMSVPGFRPPDLDLVPLAQPRGRNADPVVRQGLAQLYAMRTLNTWNGARSRAEIQQGSSSPAASLGKLAQSQILHFAARLEGLILGPEATLDNGSSPRAAAHNYSQLNAYFTSIGGGTDQIQRNIIGERILGLPKEPEVDKNIAFRDAPKATVATRSRPSI